MRRKIKISFGFLFLLSVCFFPNCQGCNRNKPWITRLTLSNWWCKIGEKVRITCEAGDLDRGKLEYRWSKNGGTFSGEGKTIWWHAPQKAGVYLIGVEVSDGRYTCQKETYICVVKEDTDKKYRVVKGFLEEDTIWEKEKNTVVVVRGDLVVKKGVCLVIKPGVVVYVQAGYDEHNLGGEKNFQEMELVEIIVKGELRVAGTPGWNKRTDIDYQEDKVYFLSTHSVPPGKIKLKELEDEKLFDCPGESERLFSTPPRGLYCAQGRRCGGSSGCQRRRGTDWAGIKFYPGSTGQVKGCYLSGAKWGIQCFSAAPEITGNLIEENGGADLYGGIYLEGAVGVRITDNEIRFSGGGIPGGNSRFDFIGGYGIYALQSTGQIFNNFFHKNGIGVRLEKCSGFIVQRNTFQNNAFINLQVLHSQALVVEENRIEDGNGYGIHIETSELKIRRNNIADNSLYGIFNHQENPLKVVVEECYIRNNNSHGQGIQYFNVTPQRELTEEIKDIGCSFSLP
jgi:parallel beta-helix repeat protein